MHANNREGATKRAQYETYALFAEAAEEALAIGKRWSIQLDEGLDAAYSNGVACWYA
jgi:hypothetical protein